VTAAQVYEIQSRLSAHASRAGGLGAGYSSDVVDTGALRTAEDLYKSFSTCAEDRKYFSGASGIKIADKEQPASGLRDSKTFAVKHTPLHAVPQVIKRGEDGTECAALVMR
jgi:hypothetical protein